MSFIPPTFPPLTPANTTCQVCRQTRNIYYDGRFFHRNEKSLRISAAKGCQLCQLFYLKFCVEAPQYPDRRNTFWMEARGGGIMLVTDFNNATRKFEIYKTGNSSSPFREIQERPDTDASYELMRSWLTECVSNHDACQEIKEPVMPRRLVAVSGILRLVEWDPHKPCEHYTALSHCWGTSQKTRLMTDTLDAFLTTINWNDLPRTFQDAIEVTRKMAIKYLWIDALCILQDSQQDWQAEAAKMGDYYKNAHLTISALSARDGETGFLATRRELHVARLSDGECWRESARSWEQILKQSPLSRRGWALQERLLSRRVLHFSKDELMWECLTCSVREGATLPLKKGTGKSLIRGNYPSNAGSVNIEQWYDLMCQYSALDLTYDTDVFAAIAGIAETFQRDTGLKYTTGHWWEHLPFGLLWYCESIKLSGTSSVAPTWSWASRRGPVKLLCDPPALVKEVTQGSANEGRAGDSLNYNSDIAKCRLQLQHSKLNPERDVKLIVDAYHMNVWCRCSCHSRDSDLRQIIDIFNQSGKRIGTGYWDRLPEDDVKECVAIVLMQQHNKFRRDICGWIADDPREVFKDTMITYFLLSERVATESAEGEECKEVFERLGIGQTVDPHDPHIFEPTWMPNTEQRTFVLR